MLYSLLVGTWFWFRCVVAGSKKTDGTLHFSFFIVSLCLSAKFFSGVTIHPVKAGKKLYLPPV
jgi:hypothetical protein